MNFSDGSKMSDEYAKASGCHYEKSIGVRYTCVCGCDKFYTREKATVEKGGAMCCCLCDTVLWSTFVGGT